jgi:tRNA-dihydrouridine synthase C
MRLPFTSFRLLAPMEGVTEPVFRDLVLARNPPEALGGTFTEFVRVVDHPLPRHMLREHLGASVFPQPVGLQLMGADVAALAETAHRAVEIGAPLVDLNFGCPAKGALRGCAGSALLREPRKLEELVRACVAAVGERPVTAKIRAGFDDVLLLEDLARAVETGGAAMLTVHCRTRAEAYCEAVDWSRIARAVAAVRIPVCGNGGVATHADFERLRRETGCAFGMVGRGALADPWIFSGVAVDAAEAADFLLHYAESLTLRGGASLAGAVARVKQLFRFWTAGELLGDDRRAWLCERDPARLLAQLRGIAGGSAPSTTARARVRTDRTTVRPSI